MPLPTHEPTIDDLLVDPEFPVYPYPLYARLHAEAPVYKSPELGYWFVSRYEDVKSVLTDAKRFSNAGWDQLYMAQLPATARREFETLDRHFDFPSLVSADPPGHTRLRRLVHRAFTPAAVERIRDHVTGAVERMLAAADAEETFDVIDAVAVPVPIGVFAFMFGMPPEQHELLKSASADFTSFVSNVRPDVDEAVRANRSLTAFRAYLLDLLEERRRQPRGDLVSVLVSPDADGDRLSDDELLSLCAHLLIAGHETTTNLIGNGLLALLDAARPARDPPRAARTDASGDRGDAALADAASAHEAHRDPSGRHRGNDDRAAATGSCC